ncbi:MAG: sigma-E factor negative regulatory protein RseC [Candidatus Cloacimonadota bacterium]|nr:sigma-E factor negative regulatory protein RseC [Candidatus Cloacimonadota bacterium]
MNNENIQDVGLVTAFERGIATVELQRGGGCKGCAMRGFCFSKSSPAVFHLPSELELHAGDKVELNISAQGRILASLLIFGLPVIALIGGFLLANQFVSELSSIILAFIAMALSFLVVRFCDKKWGQSVKIEIKRKM